MKPLPGATASVDMFRPFIVQMLWKVWVVVHRTSMEMDGERLAVVVNGINRAGAFDFPHWPNFRLGIFRFALGNPRGAIVARFFGFFVVVLPPPWA